MRLDRALRADARVALGSGSIRLFLLLELLAALALGWRMGSDAVAVVTLVWAGMLLLAFVAWWAGRHRLARPMPDPVPQPAARSALALVAATGLMLWSLPVSPAREVGFVLAACGIGGWLWSAVRSEGWRRARVVLSRDARPFVPLLLLVGLPKLLALGPWFVVSTVAALPSGIGQQLLYLVGLYAPLEALGGRPAAAAVLAALVFGAVHVPILLPVHDGDAVAATANAMLYQASVGLIACLAFQRHRAPLPLGVAHALAIA